MHIAQSTVVELVHTCRRGNVQEAPAILVRDVDEKVAVPVVVGAGSTTEGQRGSGGKKPFHQIPSARVDSVVNGVVPLGIDQPQVAPVLSQQLQL